LKREGLEMAKLGNEEMVNRLNALLSKGTESMEEGDKLILHDVSDPEIAGVYVQPFSGFAGRTEYQTVEGGYNLKTKDYKIMVVRSGQQPRVFRGTKKHPLPKAPTKDEFVSYMSTVFRVRKNL
jgi:hypothetical protein